MTGQGTTRAKWLAVLAAIAMVAAACSSSGASEAPASEAPASEAPASEAPASEAPASEAPAAMFKIGFSNNFGVGNGFREQQLCTAKAQALVSGQVGIRSPGSTRKRRPTRSSSRSAT